MSAETLFLFGLFGCGAIAGALSRTAPLSGRAALIFALTLVPLGIWLSFVFC